MDVDDGSGCETREGEDGGSGGEGAYYVRRGEMCDSEDMGVVGWVA